jgi:hypothetical protein
MYVLYYLNENYALQTIEVEHLNAPILLNEACIFTNIRKGTEFIKEPHECLQLTHLERLIISTEFFDTSAIKESDFRKAYTYLQPICQIDVDFPYFNISTFDFQAVSEVGEGYRVAFNKDTPLDKLKIRFKVGESDYTTQLLSYYLTGKPEFEDIALLVLYDDEYHFNVHKISELLNELDEPITTELCFVDAVSAEISQTYFLYDFTPIVTLNLFDRLTGIISFTPSNPDLDINRLVAMNKNYGSEEYNEIPILSRTANTFEIWNDIAEGNSIKIIDSEQLYKQSNIIILPPL